MMMHAVFGSAIIIRKRVMRQLFPARWRKFWNEWELRGMVLISLTTQVLLIILGNRRKYSAGIQVRVIVWSAYLLADSVATMAAGILSNDLGKVDVDGFIDPNVELTAFWAPLMLVHLGGTDAITAYSLEDNELWRRHLFQVVIQSVTTVYIFPICLQIFCISFTATFVLESIRMKLNPQLLLSNQRPRTVSNSFDTPRLNLRIPPKKNTLEYEQSISLMCAYQNMSLILNQIIKEN